MQKDKQLRKYILSDILTTSLSWMLFNVHRYLTVGHFSFRELSQFLMEDGILKGQIIVPFLWLFIFYISGYYHESLLKSRFEEFKDTLASTFLGTILLFFLVVLNDLPLSTGYYFDQITSLFLLNFTLVYAGRYLITRISARRVHAGEWGYNTLILGTGDQALSVVTELKSKCQQQGYLLKGFVHTGLEKKCKVETDIYGSIDGLDSLIKQNKIEMLIFAPDIRKPDAIYQTVAKISRFGLPIKLHASQHDIILGNVKVTSIYETPMIDLYKGKLQPRDENIKRSLDIILSFVSLVFLTPLFLLIAIFIKFDSQGPVLYKQERIGKYGRPFTIIKFRTMCKDAEAYGPALSKISDKRITPLGYFLRKYRIDELPQFWNVLKGEMSLVGPRPERDFYIQQISQAAPYYHLIHQVKPGITSWGMVKYGYATNVEEMIDRLQYDMLYLENASLLVDCKILIYTIRTVLTGRGI